LRSAHACACRFCAKDVPSHAAQEAVVSFSVSLALLVMSLSTGLTAGVLLLLLGGSCIADDRDWEEANSLLVKASGLEAFKPEEQPKFHLRVKFVLHNTSQGTVEGTYARDFVQTDHWSDELTAGDFRQSRVRIDKQVWTSKNADFVPLPVDFLFNALFTTSFRMTNSDAVDKVHNRKLDDIDARCIEFRSVQGRSSTAGELCVERDRGAVVYWKYGTREIWYSQYVPFASAIRPTHLMVAERGVTIVEGDVNYVEAPELTAGSFSPLENAEITDVCSTIRPVMPKHAPEPLYPPGFSRRQFPGRVIVKAEVDENGRVIKAAVVETINRIIDNMALMAVKSWQFQPRLCDGKPVSTTTRIEVHFRFK